MKQLLVEARGPARGNPFLVESPALDPPAVDVEHEFGESGLIVWRPVLASLPAALDDLPKLAVERDRLGIVVLGVGNRDNSPVPINHSPSEPEQHPAAPSGLEPWKIASAVLAVAVLALGAYELGKRRGTVPAPLAVAPTVAAATTQPVPAEAAHSPAPAPIEEPTAEPGPTLTPSFQSAVMEVTIPRPSPVRQLAAEPPSTEPTPVPVETLHDKMARCLFFRVEDDDIHSPSRVLDSVTGRRHQQLRLQFCGPGGLV